VEGELRLKKYREGKREKEGELKKKTIEGEMQTVKRGRKEKEEEEKEVKKVDRGQEKRRTRTKEIEKEIERKWEKIKGNNRRGMQTGKRKIIIIIIIIIMRQGESIQETKGETCKLKKKMEKK
jgi:hypothetical protein